MTLFHKVVSEYRKEQGMSLREFGEAIEVSHQTISLWEKGEFEPKIYALLPLALRSGDWRRDFAFDCLAALQPEHYSPLGEIGRRILSNQPIQEKQA